jgi:hypothetical protein
VEFYVEFFVELLTNKEVRNREGMGEKTSVSLIFFFFLFLQSLFCNGRWIWGFLDFSRELCGGRSNRFGVFFFLICGYGFWVK